MQGAYVLLIKLVQQADIDIGRRGSIHFQAGYYAYVGSALNSLEKRIERHLRKEKKIHWHIDYLLEKADVRHIIYAETDRKVECEIAGKLSAIFEGIKDFGCSDCKCDSHLFYSKDMEILKEEVLKIFRTLGLKPLEKAN